MINVEIKEQVNRVMDSFFPQKEFSYRNMVVASAIAKGHKNKLTSEWVRNSLLTDVEDGFMSYGIAVASQNKYMMAIENVKRMF